MKTAIEILGDGLRSKWVEPSHTVSYTTASVAMREYAEQALSMYRSKILHMPIDQRDNDFFIMAIEFEQFLP